MKTNLGFEILWDQQNTILIIPDDRLENRTCGLCGVLGMGPSNDWKMTDGSIALNAHDFGQDWFLDLDNGEPLTF